ncbi:triple tyrosine motif-containing protein [Clostridium sp. C8-1-8]|uniref:triple tyrosine motif-containing protein n=1 Tax=Clostridium sp. C8-1-8 TaxID=2698831 RepID=UPI0013705D62|nr:triple tyrosine motif-containing protein [Clostridium sp. C8-1-8]
MLITLAFQNVKAHAISIGVTSLTADRQSAKVGEIVKINASATGTKNLLYKFSIYDGARWYTLQDYSSKNSTQWQPYRPATQKIKVEVKDRYSKTIATVYKQISFEVYSTVKAQSITSSISSPVTVNTSVKFTANINLTNGVLYRYYIYDGQSWSMVRDYTYDKMYTWVPSKEGKYKVKVDIKQANSLRNPDTSIETSYEVRSSTATISNIAFDKTSPTLVNTPITITAIGGGTSSILYKFMVNDGTGWVTLKDYSVDNKFIWNPTSGASYTVRVQVKAQGSTSDFENFLDKTFVVAKLPQVQQISTNLASPRRLGNTIIISSKSVDGIASLYRYWINDGSQWILVNDYSTNSTYTWIPSKEGKYKIKVDVKDISSKNIYDGSKEIEFEILRYGSISYNNTNITLDSFVNSQMGLASKAQTWSSGNWIDATRDQAKYYADPNNFITDYGVYQFLKLNYVDGITVEDLNNVLLGKGVLEGKGASFIQAGKTYNVNPVYLVAHSLLETGNGTSALATGITVSQVHEIFGNIGSKLIPVSSPVKVYNVYGVGAYDSNPDLWGSENAYKQGWFTVDQAIVGGAKFISQSYINSTTYNQNTLYKMRWDIATIYKSPNTLYVHQYATDVGWAYKQSQIMKNIILKMKNSMFYYEIPKFN